MENETVNIEMVSPSKLRYNPENPRTITDEKFKKLCKSIEHFPQMLQLRPIVVNKDNMVLGGNMRLKAVRKVGLKLVPVLRAEHLTPEQQSEFIIKDNVAFGEWNWDNLSDWDKTLLEDWGLDFPDTVAEKEVVEDNHERPSDIPTSIKVGDLIEIGEHRLLCGSSTDADDVATLMDEKLADQVVTDPPYNVAYVGGQDSAMTILNDNMSDANFYQFLLDFYTHWMTHTKPGGAWYVWHANIESVNFMSAYKKAGLLLKQIIIWVKNQIVMGRQDYQWQHEPCIYGWKPGASHFFIDDRKQSTVIEDRINTAKMSKQQLRAMLDKLLEDKIETTVWHEDKPTRSDEHPTMKPVKLIARCIRNSSRVGEIVADGFAGSGTTMLASHQLGRICYAMELHPPYCQEIVDRMIKFDPTIVVKINGEQYHG